MSNPPRKPVILITHGAWHRPLHYRPLFDDLRAEGFTVLCPPLASSGFDDSIVTKSQLDDIKRLEETLVPYLDKGETAVVVAHSYGSLPATGVIQGNTVAERAVKGLRGGVIGAVFVACMPIIKKDVTMIESGGGVWLGDFMFELTETELVLDPEKAKKAFYGDLDMKTQDSMIAMVGRQSRMVYETNVTAVPMELDIPKTFFVTGDDVIFPRELQVAMADLWGCKQVEVAAGHSPWMVDSHREKLVEAVIERASV